MNTLDIKDLSIGFVRYGKGFARHWIWPIRRLDLRVRPGRLVAVVGESGSGKSLLAHAILGLLPENARVEGKMHYGEKELTPALQQRLRGRDIALVPQSVGALDPLMRVGRQVERAAGLSGMDDAAARAAAKGAISRYRLPSACHDFFPFQLSGGMARRALIATATAGQASVIIADEPTGGLDPESLATTLSHLRQLVNEGKAVVVITHDLGAAMEVADEVAVFCAGTTVETTTPQAFADGRPRHPYTRALWHALPENGFEANGPTADVETDGCPFHGSCDIADAVCRNHFPEPKTADGGWARCHHA